MKETRDAATEDAFHDEWVRHAARHDLRAPNADMALPCPRACAPCALDQHSLSLHSLFDRGGERLDEVIEKLRSALCAAPNCARLHQGVACLLQLGIHQNALDAPRTHPLRRAQVFRHGFYRQLLPSPGPWWRLNFITKIYECPEAAGRTRAWAAGLNEALVGLFATNPLREIIPTFRYVYAAYPAPSIARGCAFAHEGRWRMHVALENLPGEAYPLWAKRHSETEALCVLVQILFALVVARERCAFSHGDMHVDNVIVHDGAGDITFPLAGGTRVHVRGESTARIIDLDCSYAELRDDTGGTFRTGCLSLRAGLDPRRGPNALNDVSRLVATWLLSTPLSSETRRSLLEILVPPLFPGGGIPEIGELEAWERDTLCHASPEAVRAFDLREYALRVSAEVGRITGDAIVRVEEGAGEGGVATGDALLRISPTLARLARTPASVRRVEQGAGGCATARRARELAEEARASGRCDAELLRLEQAYGALLDGGSTALHPLIAENE